VKLLPQGSALLPAQEQAQRLASPLLQQLPRRPRLQHLRQLQQLEQPQVLPQLRERSLQPVEGHLLQAEQVWRVELAPSPRLQPRQRQFQSLVGQLVAQFWQVLVRGGFTSL